MKPANNPPKSSYPRRRQIARRDGVTSFSLSKLVSQIRGMKHTRKVVLRAMADRYPNIWPSVQTLSDDTGLGTTAVRASLRDLETADIASPIGNKKGGRGLSEQYILDVDRIRETAETQRLPLCLAKKPNARRCLNPTAGVAFNSETQQISDENPTRGVAEQRSNREVQSTEKENREEKPARSLSRPTPETHGQDDAREQAFEQLVEDEQEILNSIPMQLTEWVNKQEPLPCPLNTDDYPNDSPVILPWTEPAEYLSEASIAENYELACTALSFRKNPARMFLDYDATWELDRLYGNGKSVDLAEAVAEHCPKNRAFIYSYLAHSLIRSTESCTENGPT